MLVPVGTGMVTEPPLVAISDDTSTTATVPPSSATVISAWSGALVGEPLSVTVSAPALEKPLSSVAGVTVTVLDPAGSTLTVPAA